MTANEIHQVVPVQHRANQAAYIRLSDVPNPYRTECYYDHVGKDVPGKGEIWAADWTDWVAARCSDYYQPRYAEIRRLISDEDLLPV